MHHRRCRRVAHLWGSLAGRLMTSPWSPVWWPTRATHVMSSIFLPGILRGESIKNSMGPFPKVEVMTNEQQTFRPKWLNAPTTKDLKCGIIQDSKHNSNRRSPSSGICNFHPHPMSLSRRRTLWSRFTLPTHGLRRFQRFGNDQPHHTMDESSWDDRTYVWVPNVGGCLQKGAIGKAGNYTTPGAAGILN